jgi:hypothetical protein
MGARPIYGYRALLLAATAVLAVLGAAAPAGATLSPDQGTYTPASPPPLIVKAPEVPPETRPELLLPVAPVAPPGSGGVTTAAQVTPEPASFVLGLLGSGLAGFAALRRRRHRPPEEPPAGDAEEDEGSPG